MIFVRLVFSMMILWLSVNAQNKSCCSNDNLMTFAKFSDQKDFRDAHQIPLEFTLQNAKGKMITFKTDDGKKANAYYIKSAKASNKYIFVFHEWWGLNDYIKKESDELYKKLGNVNILAIDLYDGNVASTRDDASKFMQSVKPERALSIIKGAIKFAGGKASVGTIGWCFGGGWSLQTSIMLGKQGKACVVYYGIVDNTPETFKNLNAPVLGIFAEKDNWITPEVFEKLEKNLTEAGKKVKIWAFNADHAFANPSNSNFNEVATTKAKELTLDFFKENLMK